MRLAGGKFYDSDGNEVPPEFGNKEQIRLIKQAERRAEQLQGDGIYADFEETLHISFSFICICGGGNISFEDQFPTTTYDQMDIIGWSTGCFNCGRKYHIELDEYSDPVVKLIKT